MSEEDQMLVPEELEGKVQIVWGVDVIDKDRLVTPGAMKFDGDLNVVDRNVTSDLPKSKMARHVFMVNEQRDPQEVANETLTQAFVDHVDEFKGNFMRRKRLADEQERRKVAIKMEKAHQQSLANQGELIADDVEERKKEESVKLPEFTPWVDADYIPPKHVPTKEEILLQILAHRNWDRGYLLCFMAWAGLQPICQYVPSVRPIKGWLLLGMALCAILPIAIAIAYRILNARILSSCPKSKSIFWSVIFTLTIRGTAFGLSLKCLSSKSKIDHNNEGMSSEQLQELTIQPGIRRYYQKDVENGQSLITWTCRVCGTFNEKQPQRREHRRRIVHKEIPFRQRARVVCTARDFVYTTPCKKCGTRWDYMPRNCAEHLFRPAIEGDLPKVRPVLPPPPPKTAKENFVNALRLISGALGCEINQKRGELSVREMIENSWDDDKLYYLDYRLKRLSDGYLMPDLERAEFQSVVGEEVESDARQPYYMPCTIQDIKNNHVYDVKYQHGEVVRNVLKERIRGRIAYHQSTWVQWACWHILAGTLLVPLLGWWSSSVDLLPPLLLCLSTGIILIMHLHLEQILDESRPLPAKFVNSTRRLFLSPFLCLWVFLFLLTLRVVGTLFIPYTILFFLSYIFSITFSLWLYAIKPAHGLCCAVISLPWIIFEITLGLKLDGVLKGLPWILVFFPLYVSLAAVLVWHHILPYLWEENLPELSAIYQVDCLQSPTRLHPEEKTDRPEEDTSAQGTIAPLIEETINQPVDLPLSPPTSEITALDSEELENEHTNNTIDGEMEANRKGRYSNFDCPTDSEIQEKGIRSD